MIKTTKISYQYDSGSGRLDFPDIHFNSGDQALVIGQSGCGKTTLLHLLAGLLTPGSGTIEIGSTQLNKLSTTELDAFRGANIGVIFQKPHFIKALTVAENIELAQNLGGKKKDRDKVAATLELLGLKHKLNSKTNDLSEGEKQRVSIARALINNPQIILADEPTSALDDINCEAVVNLLKDVCKKVNSTLLVVTHDNRLKDQFENQISL